MISEGREMDHASSGHQLMMFAEAGIKLLVGQSQGDVRPRPRSDFQTRLLSNFSPRHAPTTDKPVLALLLRR